MIKAIIVGVIALVAAAFVSGKSYGQTATTAPTAVPTTTQTTTTPAPTSSSGTTVPNGAPSTGHGL